MLCLLVGGQGKPCPYVDTIVGTASLPSDLYIILGKLKWQYEKKDQGKLRLMEYSIVGTYVISQP